MRTRSRDSIISFFIALFLTLAAAACSGGAEPAQCHAQSECQAAARCKSGVCVADGKPIAVIAPLSALEAFALVELDGSGSSDPDAGDSVVEHAWKVTAMTAKCAPPAVAATTAAANVRFGCTGTYKVSLTVKDEMGVESAPATVEVDVIPSSQPPVVISGPDISSDHVCSGSPLVCKPEAAVALSATTTIGGLSLHWIAEPPIDRPLDGTRRVELAPGPDVASPSVSIETDGTSISGDWIFRVEASDQYGVAGAAYTRVSIMNRAPVVVAVGPADFEHHFDDVASKLTSAGQITWSASDPDGDPIEVAATWRHVGDGGATFDGELLSTTASFSVEVAYAVPADALFLRGGGGLSRTIEVAATDPNRGAGKKELAIVIGNRPPQPSGGVVDTSVPHFFDPVSGKYLATVKLGAWVDPDGDPLFGGTGTAPCEKITVENGLASAECSVDFAGVPAVNQIAGTRSIQASVRDPWSLASTVPVYSVVIKNSAPTLTAVTIPARAPSNLTWSSLTVFPIDFTVTPTATDADGDPLVLTPLPAPGGSATPKQAICTSPQCEIFSYKQPEISFFVGTYTSPSKLRASDGSAQVTIGVSPVPTAL